METPKFTLIQITQTLLLIVTLIGICWFGRDILVPIVFAFMLWFMLIAWKDLIVSTILWGKKFPAWFQNTFASISFLLILMIVGIMVYGDIVKMSQAYPEYRENVTNQISVVAESLGFPPLESGAVANASGAVDTIRSVATFISDTIGAFVVVVLYIVFIFSEQKYFKKKLAITTGGSNTEFFKVMSDIGDKIKKYIGTKSILSLATAALSYAVMYFVGLDFAFVWAFIIFALNFIPSIGSMIATFIPVFFAILQFGGLKEAFILLILIGLVQFMIGSVWEPKIMGNQLNISPLAVIASLFFWGALWGVPGMFLSVPITVVLMIILARIPTTKNIAIWISKDGVV